jgi:hypothetical protein
VTLIHLLERKEWLQKHGLLRRDDFGTHRVVECSDLHGDIMSAKKSVW